MEIKCEISVNIDSEQFYKYAVDDYMGSQDYYVECGFTTFKSFLTGSTYIRHWLDIRSRTAYTNDYEIVLLNSKLCDKVEKALIDYAVRRFEGTVSKGKTHSNRT